MLEKHSNVVPGQVRKLVVAVIVDWCAQEKLLSAALAALRRGAGAPSVCVTLEVSVLSLSLSRPSHP